MMIGETNVEHTDSLLHTNAAADFLNVKRGTIAVWKCIRKYDLKPVKIGRDNFYKKADLEIIKHARSKF